MLYVKQFDVRQMSECVDFCRIMTDERHETIDFERGITMRRREPVRDVGRLLGMIHNGVHRRREKDSFLHELEGMTGKNGWIIGYLHHNQGRPVYQKDLEKAFNVTRSTASKVLTLMEKKGFIRRQAVESDARLRQIVLTEKAEKIAAVMEEKHREMENRLTRGFSPEEKEQLTGYLNRILVNLYEESESEVKED